ncbi:hypothetical protein [Yersinia vastinensis]|uniref:hypothetical protein n=1 Tax=Yersinia vastinensis TaxID=2890318 RepID=UPI00384FCF91
MNEKPILFNAEMVNAILSGRKTQTRRIMKVQPENTHLGLRRILESKNSSENGKYFWSQSDACGTKPRSNTFSCPLGQPGDQLWVRETWNKHGGLLTYRADHDWIEEMREVAVCPAKWVPSIHMPRWASRINLLITGVRVERLNDITEQDALAEGVSANEHSPARYVFGSLWQSIYGADNPKSWQANPWVWVIEFERMEAK